MAEPRGQPHPDAYVSSVADALVAEAAEEAAALRAEAAALAARLALARRRVAAAAGRPPAAPAAAVPWLAAGKDVLVMKERLRNAAGDEDAFMAMVAEVRAAKEERTELALAFYAARTDRALRDDSSTRKRLQE